MFQPPSPPDYRMTSDLLRIPVGGERIVARYQHVEHPRATVIFAHGNGRDIGDVLGATDQLIALDLDVISFDYRGYGHSGGESSESNAYEDIDAVYRYVTSTGHVDAHDVLVLGHSLGGGPAAWLAQHEPVRGLLLASTFTSAYEVAIPSWIVPFDAFETADRLPDVRVPVVIVHGTNDEIVDVENADRLFAEANEPKRKVLIAGGGHDGIFEHAGSRLGDIVDWLLDQTT